MCGLKTKIPTAARDGMRYRGTPEISLIWLPVIDSRPGINVAKTHVKLCNFCKSKPAGKLQNAITDEMIFIKMTSQT
jgi:hypothetical protein